MGDLLLVGTFFVSIISAAVSMFCQRWWTSAALFISAAPLMGMPLDESGPNGLWAVAWVGWVVVTAGSTFAAWRLWGNAPDTTVTARGEAVTAQGAAEGARDAAVSAQGEAVTAQGEAVAARDAAATARTEAQAAEAAAVTARDEAVTAQGVADVSALAAQNDASLAVTARTEAQAAEAAAGVARDQAVAAQGAAETARTEAQAAATKLDTFAQGIENLFGAHLVSLDRKECVKALIRSYVIQAAPTATGFANARDGSVQLRNLSAAEKGILLIAIDLAGGPSSGLTVNSKIDEVLAKL